MPNLYFDNYQNFGEQELLEDLIIEAIGIYSLECFYILRTINDYDPLYGEDPISSFSTNYLIDLYIKNVDGFNGDGRFLSKFNVEIRDQITFSLPFRTFEDTIGLPEQLVRPREGDLIYVPLNMGVGYQFPYKEGKIFQIKYVQHETVFYQLGKLYVYDLVCESFEYSNENFNTGIPFIDKLQKKYSVGLSVYDLQTEDEEFALSGEDGFDLIQEAYDVGNQSIADTDYLKGQTNNVIDWSEINPFGESEL